jgi:REP element-mobilizing transposase RayT
VVLSLGIVRTHVHLLVRLHPTTSIPRPVQRLKGGSARGRLLAPHRATSRGSWPSRGFMPRSSRRPRPIESADTP